MKIGVAGVGKMGAAIAARLKDVGHDVAVWNRTAAKAEALGAQGFAVCATARELAARSDVVVTIVTNREAQAAIYDGADGLVADAGGGGGGKVFIDMSTVRPDEMRAVAAMVRGAGAAFVECPVGGTVGPARQGKLLGLAGGTAEDVTRVKPLLDQMCRRVEHLGEVGSGSAVKLAVNLPLVVAYQALGEAYVLCRDLGLDATALFELFADTSGAPQMLKLRGGTIAEGIAQGKFAPPSFDVDSIRKDLRTMIAEAGAKGARLPVAEETLRVFDGAAADGWGGRDGTSLPAYWVQKAKG